MNARRSLIAASTLVLACCTPPPEPASAPPPVATPSPAPAPAAPLAASPDNWMDAPRTPGDWSYRREAGGTMAVYGPPQADGRFFLRCDLGTRRIALARAGSAAGPVPMRILSETAERVLTAQPGGGELPMVGTTLAATDPILDAMAFSKGRFAVETGGLETLYLPSWTEVTRVIEDCR